MKAPYDERADLLQVAVRRPTQELHAPIDRVGDVDRVDCWAGSRKVSLAAYYSPGFAPIRQAPTSSKLPGRFLDGRSCTEISNFATRDLMSARLVLERPGRVI
jgi:hypothetical protein